MMIMMMIMMNRSEPGHFKTLPTRRHLERLHLSSSSVVPSDQAGYAARMSRSDDAL